MWAVTVRADHVLIAAVGDYEERLRDHGSAAVAASRQAGRPNGVLARLVSLVGGRR